MKNNKGLTLIEVIIALFLLSLITVVFLPSTWTSFRMMIHAKDMTEDTFATQKKVEQAIEEAKDKMIDYQKDNSKPNPINKTIAVFGKTVKGVAIEENIVDKNGTSIGKVNVFVGDEPIINENLPEVEWIKLVDKDKKESPVSWKNNSLTGSHKIKNTSNYFMSLKRWYVSKPGFDGYIPNKVDNESYWGIRYPSWPNDYELINNSDKDQLFDLSPYVGRHIVFSIIPVAKTGKYGVEEKSKEVYIKDSPITDNLFLHLDTYTLSDSDGTKIKEWKDLADSRKTETIGDGVELGYDNGKYLSFRNDTLTMKNKPSGNDRMTIFVVFQNTSDDSIDQNIIHRNTLSNGWKLEVRNGKLEFTINPIADNQPDRILTSDNFVYKNKYIITARVTSSDIKMIIDMDENNEILVLARGENSSYISSNMPDIKIGDNNSDQRLCEIIIYNTDLSDDEIDIIRNYLSEKHRIKLK